eukprot:552527_1
MWSVTVVCVLLVRLISSTQESENPIKHLIILMMENRSFDHYLGWLKQTNNSEIDGLNGNEFNCVIPNDTTSQCITVSKNGYDTGPDDPDHSFYGTINEIYGYNKSVNTTATPQQNGFVYSAHLLNHDITNPMRMFTINNSSSKILNTLGLEYAIFDKWFCSLPGPTDPNRAFAMSGTSNGMITDWNGTQWNQQSYFDLLTKNNISWTGYYDTVLWEFAAFKDLTKPPNSNYIHPISKFYKDLKNETQSIPSFIWIQPSYATTIENGPPNWQHPDASVEIGEQLIQSIYEALRDSVYWNESALVITYDEHGGFYDHVSPPQNNVPPPDTVYAENGFKFDRLGVRIPTILVSPWINKGTVVHSPINGPYKMSQYEGTSNIATANKLFGLDVY